MNLILLLSVISLFFLLSTISKNFYTLAALLIVSIISVLLYFATSLWLKPSIIRLKLTRQGVKGPKPYFMYGNVPQMHKIQSAAVESGSYNHGEFIAHDYTSALFPYFEQWRKQYGLIYTYSTGNKQHLYINKAELVKEMNQCLTSSGLGKPSYVTKRLAPMLGNGILRSNGHLWAQQRKIVAPEFFMDKVKCMLGLMLESTQPLLKKWEESIDSQGGKMAEIQIEEDLRSVSADVISRTCFGSSYFKGKLIFSKLRTLQQTISSGSFLFALPTFGFLASKNHKEIKSLETEIESLIWDVVKEREKECSEKSSSEKDLLQMLLEGAIHDQFLGAKSSKSFIVDNCKNIYFAGHESTAVAASWSIMLLALHPEWQSRIREEMSQVSKNGTLDSDSLSKMKTVTMVIQEALRLYPPAAFVSREAFAETKIGNINIPKGVCIWTLIPTLHRDPDNWGSDSHEFKPERFANGVSNACKIPQAYVPFGLGPRLCLGRNFAMVQLKVVISLIISKFKFSLSPNYKHSPHYKMIVEPGNGVNILIQKV